MKTSKLSLKIVLPILVLTPVVSAVDPPEE